MSVEEQSIYVLSVASSGTHNSSECCSCHYPSLLYHEWTATTGLEIWMLILQCSLSLSAKST